MNPPPNYLSHYKTFFHWYCNKLKLSNMLSLPFCIEVWKLSVAPSRGVYNLNKQDRPKPEGETDKWNDVPRVMQLASSRAQVNLKGPCYQNYVFFQYEKLG